MRPIGKFKYLLSTINGGFISEIVSGVEIKESDELNYKGNKLYVVKKAVENVLVVVKIGEAIIVE